MDSMKRLEILAVLDRWENRLAACARKTVECKCHRHVALKDFIMHVLTCESVPEDHRWLVVLALRVLLRNPEESLRVLATREQTKRKPD